MARVSFDKMIEEHGFKVVFKSNGDVTYYKKFFDGNYIEIKKFRYFKTGKITWSIFNMKGNSDYWVTKARVTEMLREALNY